MISVRLGVQPALDIPQDGYKGGGILPCEEHCVGHLDVGESAVRIDDVTAPAGDGNKMRLDAMKRTAGRPSKENSSPVGTHFRSDEILAQECGDSRNQIQRYIRLTHLIPDILEMVDEGRIAFRPAVELSYLSEAEQAYLLEEMTYNDATPSLAQAIKMHSFLKPRCPFLLLQHKGLRYTRRDRHLQRSCHRYAAHYLLPESGAVRFPQ